MSKICFLLAFALIVGLSAVTGVVAQPSGAAEKADLQTLFDALRVNRKAMVAVNLELTDDEAARFWPIYDRYQKEMSALGDRLAALVGDYSKNFRDMSNEKALELVDDYLSIEAERVQVRRAYVDEFARSIPGVKLARFYQLENKMDAVIRYEMAATIPVIE